MPLSVQRSVRKQNIKFLHNRIHFSPEYFHFMKRLVQSNVQVIVNFFQPPPAAAGAPQTEKISSTNVMIYRLFLLTSLGATLILDHRSNGRTSVGERSDRDEVSLLGWMAHQESSTVRRITALLVGSIWKWFVFCLQRSSDRLDRIDHSLHSLVKISAILSSQWSALQTSQSISRISDRLHFRWGTVDKLLIALRHLFDSIL